MTKNVFLDEKHDSQSLNVHFRSPSEQLDSTYDLRTTQFKPPPLSPTRQRVYLGIYLSGNYVTTAWK